MCPLIGFIFLLLLLLLFSVLIQLNCGLLQELKWVDLTL